MRHEYSILSSGYAPLLADLKTRVRVVQVKAVAVNRELILLHRDFGRGGDVAGGAR